MESILYLVTGSIFKVYDDITDGNKEVSSFHLELLKVLTTTLLTISFMKSPMFTFFFCVMAIFCLLNQSADTDFWKAGTVIPFLTVLFHIPYFLSLSFFDYSIRIAVLLIIVLFLFYEHISFPEDMSLQKYCFRILLNLFFILSIYVSNLYEYTFLNPLWLFGLGYFGTNLIYHFPTFLTYFSTSQTSASPDDKSSSISNTELKK